MIQFLSLFSGIGAFEKALDRLGIDYNLVNYCEIDKYASKSYAAVHNVPESLNLGDITKVDAKKLPHIDMISYGFPCQDISLAGKQQGLFNEDGTATRSGLFFEALRIIEDTKPKVAIAENVKNLTSKKFKEQFDIVLESLEQAGYNNYWQVLNAKDYGIPQNRERVFIVSIRKDIDTGTFKFPEPFELDLRLRDLLETEVDEKYYLNDKTIKVFLRDFGSKGKILDDDAITPTLTASMGGGGGNMPCVRLGESTDKCIQVADLNHYQNDQMNRVYSPDGIAPTQLVKSGGGRETKILVNKIDIPQTVTVRKYPVDTNLLCECLRDHKEKYDFTNKEIAETLSVPVTQVEHWFRRDNSFAIPDVNIWFKLKELLGITTDEFDKSIMTFEEREGVYEKSERHYFTDGLSPTLTSTSAGNEKILVKENTKRGYTEASEGDSINFEQPNSKTRRGRVGKQVAQTLTTSPQQGVVTNFVNGDVCKTIRANGHGSTDRHSWDMVECKNTLRIRKLTPLECWRLMGFDDEDFYRAEKVNSNTQLYKQAGNSIVVDVLEYLFKQIMEVINVKKIEEVKTITYECDDLIDVAALKEKEPELYEELVRDYPAESATYVFKNKIA